MSASGYHGTPGLGTPGLAPSVWVFQAFVFLVWVPPVCVPWSGHPWSGQTWSGYPQSGQPLSRYPLQGRIQHGCSGCICTRWDLVMGAMHPSRNGPRVFKIAGLIFAHLIKLKYGHPKSLTNHILQHFNLQRQTIPL